MPIILVLSMLLSPILGIFSYILLICALAFLAFLVFFLSSYSMNEFILSTIKESDDMKEKYKNKVMILNDLINTAITGCSSYFLYIHSFVFASGVVAAMCAIVFMYLVIRYIVVMTPEADNSDTPDED